MGSTIPEDQPVILDQSAYRNVLEFVNQEEPGPQINVYGQVTALDRKNHNFRLSVAGYSQRFVCRYGKHLREKIRTSVGSDELIIAKGIPHYRPSQLGILPPKYIQVSGVEKAPENPGWDIQIRNSEGIFVPVFGNQPATLWDSDEDKAV